MDFSNVTDAVNSGRFGYIELQFHNEHVTMKDVKKVIFAENPTPKIKKLLAEKGIDWEIEK